MTSVEHGGMEGETTHADASTPHLHIHRTGDLQPDWTSLYYRCDCRSSEYLDWRLARQGQAVEVD